MPNSNPEAVFFCLLPQFISVNKRITRPLSASFKQCHPAGIRCACGPRRRPPRLFMCRSFTFSSRRLLLQAPDLFTLFPILSLSFFNHVHTVIPSANVFTSVFFTTRSHAGPLILTASLAWPPFLRWERLERRRRE